MADSAKTTFSQDDFDSGLATLSELIATSKVLAPFRPIEMIVAGGFVSVNFLRNRKSTEDLDYFLNQNTYVGQFDQVQSELVRFIEIVADKLKFNKRWCNNNVKVFLSLLPDPEQLYRESKAQNVVLYRDASLILYAVKFEWVLARKLKRIQMEGQPARNKDWNDCVSITWALWRSRGRLSTQMLQLYDNPDREPPVFETTVVNLRKLVNKIHGKDPFVDERDTADATGGGK